VVDDALLGVCLDIATQRSFPGGGGEDWVELGYGTWEKCNICNNCRDCRNWKMMKGRGRREGEGRRGKGKMEWV
jgi:hypothetical protein